jgi:hypothetical protein
LKENRAAEAISLRREHGQLLRSLFDASAKLLKLEESSGKVIGVDKALALIKLDAIGSYSFEKTAGARQNTGRACTARGVSVFGLE